MNTFRFLFLLTFVLGTLDATAAPIVKAGGQPGAATSWTSKGQTVVLEVHESYDAVEVAAAITKGVKGAKAKARSGKVTVTGMSEKLLLAALTKIDVEPAMDDVDAMLTSLKNGPDDDEGSGSSIRATQAADFSDVLGKVDDRITGEVIGVTRARFPLVIVSVKIANVPAGMKDLKVGDRITVVPRVKSKEGVIDPNDRASQLNVGAWYAQEGDTVVMRLGKKQKKKFWVAQGFERRAAAK